MASEPLPEFVRVTGCDALATPTVWLAKVRVAGARAVLGPMPIPVKEMWCGDPAALSCSVTDPEREPEAVGVKVIEKLQLPAAGTLVPQVSVSAKSPLAVMEEIERAALPRLRSSTLCGWLAEPIARAEYVNETGVKPTAGADAAPTLAMKASVLPPGTP